MEIDVLRIGKLTFLVAATALIGSSLVMTGEAQAGKIHWKEDPLARGCFALAFDDTDQWFATPQGLAFKRGVCQGQPVRYRIDLDPDGEHFTVAGAKSCTYHVGEGHEITVQCGKNAR
jgi:hypothetical protein